MKSKENKNDEVKSAGEIAAERAVKVDGEQKYESAKIKEIEEQMLRLRADLDNTKKRLERDKIEAIKFANERLLEEILPIVDNMDRAMQSLSEGHDPEKVKAGLQIAQKELHDVLVEHGVEMVKSIGEEFNPQFHEAIGVVDSPDAKEGMILEEVQRGYTLNGRLIRPSRVRIAQKNET